MYRILGLVFMLVILHVSPLQAAPSGPSGQIKIGVFPLEPINSLGRSGEVQGFIPSLIKKIAENEGWQPVFVPGSWGEGLERLQSGEIDLLDAVAYTPERAGVMDYSYEPIMEIWGQLFIRPGDQINKMDELNGQRVAIMRDGINGKNFQKVLAQLGIKCEFKVYPNMADVMTAVQTGEVVAGVAPQHFGLRHAKDFGLVPSSIQFSPFPIYFATRKGEHRQLLSQIDSYLIRWKQDQNSYYYQQLNHWLSGDRQSGYIIPRWLLISMSGAAAAVLVFMSLSLLLKSQVRKRTLELVTVNNELTRSEQRYRNLIESMVQPMSLQEIICDKNGKPINYRYLGINAAFERLLGKSSDEIIGKTLMELLPKTEKSWLETYGRVVQSGIAEHFEGYSRDLKRHFDIVAFATAPGQFAVIATDISARVEMQNEQQRLQDKLLHAQKLESLGVLAGGIAHDFNNILMAVLGHCELTLRRLTNESPVRRNIEQIKSAANKAADLANQMLAYSGKGKFVVEPLDLSKVVNEMQQMLRVSISKKAVLRYDLAEGLPSIEADATQICQVVMNLAINASDAIGDNNGVITITTGVMMCDQSYLQEAWLDNNLPNGQYVFLEIADTGCGMDKQTANRIFEPFFSTKFSGRGLGMAAVLGIVRGHRGAIKIYTEQGKGTSFKVFFPASSKLALQPDTIQESLPIKGSGTVLLVDDEDSVLSIGKAMLEEFGFDVLTAVDGRDGLEQFKQRHADIRFVLMDLTMPNMGGEEAFREFRRIDPAVKVIICSGYNQQEVSQKFVGKGLAGFLKKPYQLAELQTRIQELLSNQ